MPTPARDSRDHFEKTDAEAVIQPVISSNHHQSLFEQAPIGYCTALQNGSIREINQAGRSLLGITSQCVAGSSLTDFVVAEHRARLLDHLKQAASLNEPVSCDLQLQKSDGSFVSVSLVSVLAESTATDLLLLIVLKNVSDRNSEDLLLLESDDRFKHAIGATRDGIWDWDIPTGTVYFSPQWAQLLGYEPDEVPQRVEFFFTVLHPDDIERVTRILNDHLSGKTPVKQDEVRLKTRSGEYRWFLDRGEVVTRDSAGTPIRMVGTITDITQRRQAEDALKESQARTRLLIKAASLGLWDWNLLTNDVYFSPEWKQHLGYADHELPNDFQEWKSRLHPDDVDRTLAAVDAFFAGQRPAYDIEFRMLHKDGSWRWIFARADVSRDENGRPSRMMGCHLDITERKIAEQELSRSYSLMRATLESTADGILVVSSEGKIETFNRVFCEMWRTPPEALVGAIDGDLMSHASAQLRHPDLFLEKVQYLYSHAAEESFDTLEFHDGRVFERYSCPQLIDGQVVGRVWSFRDITERRQAEAAQFEALSRLQKIGSRIPGLVYQYRLRPDGTSCFPYASEGIRELFGVDPEEVRENVNIERSLIDPAPFVESIRRSATDLTPWVQEFQIQHHDGSIHWLAGNSQPERESDGSILWHGVVTDITKRRVAEQKLRESEYRLREAQAISQIGNFHWNAQTNKVTWSDELYKVYGHEPGIFEPSFDKYIAAIHPDDQPRVLQILQQTMENKSRFDHQYRVILPDDALRWVHARGMAIVNGDGVFEGLEGTCQDITENRKAEAAHAFLEAQLRESQKMEAIGTLAGGIAHDFNNILAAILGNVEIASHEDIGNPVASKCLDDIRNAGSRARDLIQQILSFSRRQPTDRKQIRLTSVIAESARLLRATLPANLTLHVHCDDDVPAVMADATQIEQVILNLATNAMQAMHGGRGQISIQLSAMQLSSSETSANNSLQQLQEKHPGQVVRLIVSDNGPGIDPAIIPRIFEPFFTTKPVDEGTGLGLSVVHGIVQGHESVITVESAVGQGASFTIFFPAAVNQDPIAEEKLAAELPPKPPESVTPRHILYLDDDNSVLLLVKRLLERRGFRVSCFVSQNEALSALSSAPESFDLVVTDYNMPGMHGLEVAREVRAIRPGLPIAVTSGFIDEDLQKGAELSGVKQLISKPFALEELYAVIQRLANPAVPSET